MSDSRPNRITDSRSMRFDRLCRVDHPQPKGPWRRCFALLLSLGVLAAGALGLSACGGSGGAGGGAQFLNTPTAIATPIGYQPTSAAGANPVTITVRSGADVQLTGEDSDNGNITITSFEWKQTDSAPTPSVVLTYRNSSTVSFTAPDASPTPLHFQLTVTNAAGGTASSTVAVTVQTAGDSNRFLSLLSIPHHFRVALGLKTATAAAGSAIALSADLPVCVKVQSSIAYPSRGAGELQFPLPAQQVDAKWVAASGALAGLATAQTPAYLAYRNPVVSFDLPGLNDDLIFQKYNGPGATSAEIADQIVLSDVASAYVPMVVSATPGSCDGTQSGDALDGAQLVLGLETEGGTTFATATGTAGEAVSVSSSTSNPSPLTPAGTATLTADDFLRAASLGSAAETANTEIETRESTNAYYAAIDPANARTTFADWLTVNCFDANSTTYGAGEANYNVVHADYTNNFDLGFGRDMYFATCANGQMASVVVNYPSLEAAANHIGAFLAVAMEYTPEAAPAPAAKSTVACFTNPSDPKTNTGMCFTKFFAFAPDDRTGEFKRVLSANFDRRGQKYLPGACTVCHGGTPNYTPSSPNAAYSHGPRGAGDIDSSFMPWDVGALLFSDTDTSFACNVATISPSCESLNPALYTKSAQEPNIQKLNALAYRTWDIYSAHVEKFPDGTLRYQAPVDLVAKWYGGDPGTSSAHAYDDSATPAAWATPSQSAPSDLYHQVFAHQCRACHTQNDTEAQQFSSYAQFEALLKPNVSPLLKNRLNVQQMVFNNAQMPLSRLTADRFWVNYDGGTSPAQTLATFINAASGAAPVSVDAGNVVPPGQPLVMPLQFSQSGPTTAASGKPLSTTGTNTLTRFEGLNLDALTQSLFVSTYQWTLCGGEAPTVAGGACPSTSYELIGSAASAQTGTSLPSLSTAQPGSYFLTLTTTSSVPGIAPVSQTFQLNVPQSNPVLATCPKSQANYNVDTTTIAANTVSIALVPCFATLAGQAQLGDPAYTALVSYDGTTFGSAAGGPSLAWSATVAPGTPVIDPNTGLNTAVPTLQFNFNPSAIGDATLYFEWCDGNGSTDEGCVRSSVKVSLMTGLSATTGATFLGYWDPRVNADYGVSSTPFTPPSGGLAMSPTLPLAALNAHLTVDAPSATLSLGAASDGGTFSSASLTGTPAQISSAVDALTYTPCGNFVTSDVNGGALMGSGTGSGCKSVTGSVGFTYYLTDAAMPNPPTTPPALPAATIDIRALASFLNGSQKLYSTGADTSGILNVSCATAGCHLSGGGGTGLPYWTFTANDTSGTYSSIKSGRDNQTPSQPLVIPGHPESSAFYTAPCLGSDALMAQVFDPHTAQCLVIYQWILEGGQLD